MPRIVLANYLWFFSNFDPQNFVEGDEDKVSFMDDVEKKDYVGLINLEIVVISIPYFKCYLNTLIFHV